jgi:hypothetical protein
VVCGGLQLMYTHRYCSHDSTSVAQQYCRLAAQRVPAGRPHLVLLSTSSPSQLMRRGSGLWTSIHGTRSICTLPSASCRPPLSTSFTASLTCRQGHHLHQLRAGPPPSHQPTSTAVPCLSPVYITAAAGSTTQDHHRLTQQALSSITLLVCIRVGKAKLGQQKGAGLSNSSCSTPITAAFSCKPYSTSSQAPTICVSARMYSLSWQSHAPRKDHSQQCPAAAVHQDRRAPLPLPTW